MENGELGQYILEFNKASLESFYQDIGASCLLFCKESTGLRASNMLCSLLLASLHHQGLVNVGNDTATGNRSLDQSV